MINAIIFTKDRACQMRLLLESIDKHANGVFRLNAIYTASTPEFEQGYEQLKQDELSAGVTWIKQDNFKDDVLNALKTDCKYSCFFTDDDILYRPVAAAEMLQELDTDNQTFCFSMRLGENVTYCYSMSCENILRNQEEVGNLIKFEWNKHFMDFGYPLSVDGHIFRTPEITRLTKNSKFTNPNTFEAALQNFDNFPRPKMVAYKHSALVNTPVNIVQNVYENRQGEQYGITAKDFNAKYLAGEVISYDAIDFSKIIGCHQELPLTFTKHANKEGNTVQG